MTTIDVTVYRSPNSMYTKLLKLKLLPTLTKMILTSPQLECKNVPNLIKFSNDQKSFSLVIECTASPKQLLNTRYEEAIQISQFG